MFGGLEPSKGDPTVAVSPDRIKELLGNGLSNEVVATAVGVHPSYISQLMSNEEFAGEVVALRTQRLTSYTNRDSKWDTVEDKLLAKLEDIVDNDMIYKPTALLMALRTVNMAKRRGAVVQDSVTVNQQIVMLSMPSTVIQSYVQNSTGEVVEVEGQTLVTMPAQALLQKLAASSEEKERYVRAQRFLPATAGPEKAS